MAEGHEPMPEDETTQKPVGPFDTMEACVSHFEGDPDVDDPGALCQWMEQNQEASAVQQYTPAEDEVQSLVEAMKEPQAESVLTNLEVTYVSGVENPAQDSQWVMAKDADSQGADWGVTAPILLHEGTQTTTVSGGARAPIWAKEGEDDQDGEGEEQQKAWAPVLIPNETDKQGDVIPPEAIGKAAHQFLATYRKIDTDHDLFEGKGTPIESWTLKEASTFTLPDGSESREYPKGTWMMGVKFVDKAWERIKSGELTGFSIYGEATSHEIQDILGGEADLEVGAGTVEAAQATAKGADDGDSDMSENEEEDSLPGELDQEALKGLSNGEVKELIRMLQAQIEAEDEDDEEDDEDEEEAEEGPPMSAGKDEGESESTEDEQPMKEVLEDVRDTVKSTQESVESHGERLEALENEVFEKADEDAGTETEAGEGEQPNTEDVEQAAEAAAEKQVKDLLGLDSLPEDPEERQEVVRKHFHEQPDEGTSIGNPDDWSDDEVSEVVK